MGLFGGDSTANTTQNITTVTGNNEGASNSINFNAGSGKRANLRNYSVPTYLSIGDKAVEQGFRTVRESNQSVTGQGVKGSIASILGLADGATVWILGGIVALYLFVSLASKAMRGGL